MVATSHFSHLFGFRAAVCCCSNIIFYNDLLLKNSPSVFFITIFTISYSCLLMKCRAVLFPKLHSFCTSLTLFLSHFSSAVPPPPPSSWMHPRLCDYACALFMMFVIHFSVGIPDGISKSLD